MTRPSARLKRATRSAMRNIMRRYSRMRNCSGARATISRCIGSTARGKASLKIATAPGASPVRRATCTDDSPGRAPPPQKCTKLICAPRFIILCAATARSNPPDSRHVMRPAVLERKASGPGKFSRIHQQRRSGRDFNPASKVRIRKLHARIAAFRGSQLIHQILSNRHVDVEGTLRKRFVAALGTHRKRRKFLATNFFPRRAAQRGDIVFGASAGNHPSDRRKTPHRKRARSAPPPLPPKRLRRIPPAFDHRDVGFAPPATLPKRASAPSAAC